MSVLRRHQRRSHRQLRVLHTLAALTRRNHTIATMINAPSVQTALPVDALTCAVRDHAIQRNASAARVSKVTTARSPIVTVPRTASVAMVARATL